MLLPIDVPQASWTIGGAAFAPLHALARLVISADGENVIEALGSTQVEVWTRAFLRTGEGGGAGYGREVG
jgi:hypothetical protein